MKVGLFAKKVGMTLIYDEAGNLLPVTILKANLCQVSQIKTVAKNGYNAVQVAYGENKFDKLTMQIKGHLRKSGDLAFKSFGEFRVSKPEEFTLGEVIKVDTFTIGQKVRITGKSIGKGFAGNQKRHNFSRGPMTHGSKNHRLPGSIGAGSTPGRVYPGKKMAGQLGRKTVTIKNMGILYLNSEDNILILKGSVPGKNNTVVKIQHQRY
jgi:large subunit ribosomal protein L3